MKRVLLIIGIVIAVLGVGAGIVVSRVDPETMRAYLVKASTEATGKPLYLERTPQLSFMPLGVSFGAATWGMADGKPAAQGISVAVKGGVVRLDLLPLLSGRIVVREVRLDSPQVVVRPEGTAAAAPAKTPKSAGTEILPLELARLSISNGSLLLDMGKGQVRVENFNASVTDMKPGGEASVKLDMGVACAEPAVTGNLAFAAYIRQMNGGVALRQAKVTFTQLRGPLPAVAGPVQVALDAMLTSGQAALDNIKGSLGNITLAGAVALEWGEVPAVRGRLQLGDINVDALLAATGKNTPSPADSMAAAPAQSANAANAKDGKPAVYPQVDMDIQALSVTVRKVRLQQLRAHVKGQGGHSTQYAAAPLSWTFATGGTYAGTASVELPGLRYRSSGAVQGLVLGALMQAVQGKRPVDGVASLDYSLSCEGKDAAAIKGSLAGKGLLAATDMQLNGVSLLPKGAPVQGGIPTHFSQLRVPFTAQNGIISINGMSLHGEGISAAGKGMVRLPQEDMDMAATLSMLGMQIPVTISGPLANLSYGVDPKWAARMLMRAPGALLEGGKSAGGAAGDAAKAAGNKTGDVVRGLGGAVKGLFGQ